MQKQQKQRLYHLVLIAIMAALGLALMNIRFPLMPAAPWLYYDLGDIPAIFTTLIAGPISGLTVLLIVCTIEAVTVSISGFWGFVMHFAGTGSMILALSLLFWLGRKWVVARRGQDAWSGGTRIKWLALGMLTAAVALTAAMIPLNLIVTPLYTGVSRQDVLQMIVPVLLPFNVIKGLLHGAVTLLVYIPLRPAVERVEQKLFDQQIQDQQAR